MFTFQLNQTGASVSSFAKKNQEQKEGMSMKSNFKILFFIRREKTDKIRNLSPLYLRITCGKRTEISLNKKVNPNKWNSQKQCVSGNSPEAKAINDFLKSVEVRLYNIHTTLLTKEELINADILKAYFLGKTERQKTVLEAFDYHLKHNEKNYSSSTGDKYGYCKSHLKNYIWKTFGTTDILLSKIDLPFIKEFQLYLSEESQFADESGQIIKKAANDHNSTLKYLKMFKTVITNAVAYGWIDANPFALFKEKFKAVEQVYLDEGELNKIIELNTSLDRLKLVKDLFIFSCFTGLAYADLKKLSKEHIVFGIDGNKWIKICRTKTNTICKIPLLPMAESILKEYTSHPVCINTGRLLPVGSNQKLNAYLKEIADLAGIPKNLTVHVARRTFATIAIDNNVPAETVVKIIGHSTFKHLHLYAKTGERKLAEDIKVLRRKFGESAFNSCDAYPLQKSS